MLYHRWCMSEWAWGTGGILLTRENRDTHKNLCSISALSTSHPTWNGFGLNPDLHCDRPANNCLNHDRYLYFSGFFIPFAFSPLFPGILDCKLFNSNSRIRTDIYYHFGWLYDYQTFPLRIWKARVQLSARIHAILTNFAVSLLPSGKFNVNNFIQATTTSFTSCAINFQYSDYTFSWRCIILVDWK